MEPQGQQVPFPLRREGDLRGIVDLERRIKLLDEAIARVQQTETRLQESEAAFRRLTEECGGLLYAVTTVEQLEALNGRMSQLVEESARRLGEFEEGVSREWQSLRSQYEEPLQAIQQQALAIRKVSLEAAESALLCKHVAEEAFASVIAQGRASLNLPSGQAPDARPWSLDDVNRVHREVRSAQQRDGEPGAPTDAPGAGTRPGGTVIDVPAEQPRNGARGGVFRWVMLGLALVAGAVAAAYSMQMRQRVVVLDTRVQEATTRIADAERQTAEVRRLAQQQVLEAQQTARYAQAVAEIVAAPDLRRLSLVGRELAPDASAQALFSRMRGFHLSASQLPPPPPGKVYHVWALGRGEAASLGVLESTPDGHGDLLVSRALTFPPATGVIVSLEDSAGTEQPTGAVYLGPRPPLEE